MIYYTADQHFGHAKIIELCNRPFSSVKEMNRALIDNWNKVVNKDDTVYILGDLAYRSPVSMKPVLKELKGIKHLIRGNHDGGWPKNLKLEDFFESVSDFLEINDGSALVTLCHYPLFSWKRKKYGALHIHGHIHNTRCEGLEILKNMNAFNASVDVNGFMPVTLAQLVANKELHCSGIQSVSCENIEE